jgi:uncharacterized protein YbjQ (UPF0145 family)
MIVTTTQDIPGREITEILGLARGNSVRARHAGATSWQASEISLVAKYLNTPTSKPKHEKWRHDE